MAIESPLFQSSLELFGHSITHYNGKEEIDRKLLILHLANAIELILKDILLDLGESIYKNPKETVTIQSCFESLKNKGFNVPYLNKVELLIDERNALQHRFGSPNELTAIFYMSIATDFFRETLENHYKQDFDEVVAQFTPIKDLAAFLINKPCNKSEIENLKKLAKVHPLNALLSITDYLESKITTFRHEIGLNREIRFQNPRMYQSTRYLSQFGIVVPPNLEREMDKLRRMRNLAAHGRKDPSKEDVFQCIASVEKFENFLNSVDKVKTKQNVEIYLQQKRTSVDSNQQLNLEFS